MKNSVDDLLLEHTERHYVTRRSYRMQKQKFSIMCHEALFVKPIPVLLEHEKWCIDVLHPEGTEMHYETHRSHRM
jgi:hypothetical protein